MSDDYERRVKWTEVFATVDGDRWEATPTDRKERLIAAYRPEVDAAMKLADLEKHREREERDLWEAWCLDAREERDALKAELLEAQKDLEEAKESREAWKAKYLDDPFSPRKFQECSFKETGVHVSALCCPSKSVEDDEKAELKNQIENRDATIEELERQVHDQGVKINDHTLEIGRLRQQSMAQRTAIDQAGRWLKGLGPGGDFEERHGLAQLVDGSWDDYE